VKRKMGTFAEHFKMGTFACAHVHKLQDYVALVEGDAWYLDDAKAFNLFPGTNR
jgi:hypothetical protein